MDDLLQVQQYLQETPCTNQSPSVIQNFIEATSNIPITKFERLQLLNLRPSNLVQLHQVAIVAF